MRISIDVPGWAADRHIYIMAGIELLAYVPYGKSKLYLKTARCNFCGRCCRPPGDPTLPRSEDGSCGHLRKVGREYTCGLGQARPFHCSFYDPAQFNHLDDCSVRYQEIDL